MYALVVQFQHMKRYTILGVFIGMLLTFSTVTIASSDMSLEARNAYLDQVLSSLISKVGQLTAENTSLRAQLSMTAQGTNSIKISNVQIESVNDNFSSSYVQDKITWTTSTPTTAKVYYTLLNDTHVADTNTDLSTEHTAYIRGVNHGDTYSYTIEVTDGSTNVTKVGTATVR